MHNVKILTASYKTRKLLPKLLIVALFILAACSSEATSTPDTSGDQAAPSDTPESQAEASPTALSPTDTEAPPSEAATDAPPTEDATANTSETVALAGDPENGKTLFENQQPGAGIACAQCHQADSEETLVGPGLLRVGERAQTRVAGQSAVEYLRTSIVDPNAFVVDSFAPGIMPRNWAQVLTESQINDIIAYLLTLE